MDVCHLLGLLSYALREQTARQDDIAVQYFALFAFHNSHFGTRCDGLPCLGASKRHTSLGDTKYNHPMIEAHLHVTIVSE